MDKGLGILGIIGAAVGVGMMLHFDDKRRFNKLAAGLTDDQRKLARKFWNAAIRDQNDERAKHAAAVAQLEHVEQARIALDRLDKAVTALHDPTCDRQVSAWIVEHWLVETSKALRGNASLDTKMAASEEVDATLNQIQQRVLAKMQEMTNDE